VPSLIFRLQKKPAHLNRRIEPIERDVPEESLVFRDGMIRFERRIKHRFETAFLVPVMHHHYGRHAHRLLALATRRRFTLQILYESISEVISSARAPGVLHAMVPAVGTRELYVVLERIAVQRGPSRVTDPNCLQRIFHDDCLSIPKRGYEQNIRRKKFQIDAITTTKIVICSI
jgi:hypothetical protein